MGQTSCHTAWRNFKNDIEDFSAGEFKLYIYASINVKRYVNVNNPIYFKCINKINSLFTYKYIVKNYFCKFSLQSVMDIKIILMNYTPFT